MPENKKISDLPDDLSVTLADYVPIVTPGSTETKKATLARVLALGGSSGGSTGPGAVFLDSFVVNLPVNNTGIPNGTAVNAGDPMAPFLKAAFSKATPPTVAVNTNSNNQPYNQINIDLNVSMTYTITTAGATLANIKLERSRDNATWTTLVDAATATSPYADNGLNPLVDNRPIYYRLTITDSAGGANSNTGVVNFATYAAPGISFSVGSTTRERAVVSSTITGTITRNSPNIALTSYQLQYQVNGAGAWTDVGSPVTASGSSQAISVAHNDSALNSSNSLSYRIQVVDAQQTTTSATSAITFIYPYFYGKQSTASTSFDVYATGTKVVTPGSGSLSINFASSAQFEWFAVEDSLPNKTTWFVNALDNGAIGGSSNLFATGTTVTVTGTGWSRSYKIYITNYATSHSTNMTIS